ncbi:MAG: hypothetical protein U0T36_07975 [Saprospiraceae bacterium]
MTKKRFHLFFFAFLAIFVVQGQSNLELDTWKSHLSFKSGIKVTKTKDKIVYASARGLFTVDQNDLSVKFFSKEDGLSDVIIQHLYYDKNQDQLFIIYADNNIDIISGAEVINIPTIKNNTSVLGSKTINDIFFSEDIAYIATDFGVLGFDLISHEFLFTTFTSQKIDCVGYHNGVIYASSETNLYYFPKSGTNISDFNSWSLRTQLTGTITNMAVKYNKLFLSTYTQVLMVNSDTIVELLHVTDPEAIGFLSEEGSTLMIGIKKGTEGRTIFYEENGNTVEKGYGCARLVQYAVEDNKGRVWYGDIWEPIKYTESKTEDCKYLRFSVPYDNDASGITFKKDKAYFGSNGVTEDFGYKYTRYGYYTLQNNEWINYSPENFPALNAYDLFHIRTVALHPKNDDIYLGSYYNGLLKYNEVTKETQHWNKYNSVLGGTVGDSSRTRIAGLVFDKDENLWISSYGAVKPLVVKTKDNTWHSFAVPGNTNLHQIAIDDNGNKWIAVHGVGNGLLVYNEGSKISDPTDDKSRNINRNNSEIKGNKVNCVSVDLDGSVWVGTDEGPVVFDCGDPFSNDCKGSTRKVIVDNIPAPLLRYEDILSIAIDGANRKWFGTRNGIFVQSPDGISQISKYDVQNSPLLDNIVRELAYNPTTGEMFIVTQGGIQSLKTETTGGKNSNASNVYAFPNPVRPEYTGPIAIKGLIRDANVKITDINGKLVFETKALGGQAIWDGMDYNGDKAATGVYLVFSANAENTSLQAEALVTKILIVH